jgi:DNA-directed RNA polymerase subunit F
MLLINLSISLENQKTTKIMQNLVKQIETQIEAYTENVAAHVEKGNKAAGARARKATLELTKLFKEFRKQSVAMK